MQNAFDAVRMRAARDDQFQPNISVSVDVEKIVVIDNGIGMTLEEVETNFWYAGKSSKNTATARAAGVVGTFGIGAMSNFGVADELTVESESSVTGQRTISTARKSELATDSASISLRSIPTVGSPGTIVTARLSSESGVSIPEARKYVTQFVEFLDVPVHFNGEQISGSSHRTALPSERHAWSERRATVSLANLLSGDLEIIGMASGELRVVMQNVQSTGEHQRPGTIVLLQDQNVVRTLRSGFGLAQIAVPSIYQWGGVIDLPFLTPTAGREALDDVSHNPAPASRDSLGPSGLADRC